MKLLLYAISIVVMTLTVPWFFTTEHNATAVEPGAGLPVWVWYVIGASAFYAVLVAILVHFFWGTSADHEEPSTQRDGGIDA